MRLQVAEKGRLPWRKVVLKDVICQWKREVRFWVGMEDWAVVHVWVVKKMIMGNRMRQHFFTHLMCLLDICRTPALIPRTHSPVELTIWRGTQI